MEYRKNINHYRNSEKQKELRKKEELFSRLKVHSEKTTESKQDSPHNNTQYKELYKKAKKEKDKFQKENLTLKGKNIELNTNLLKEKEENQRLRKLLFEAKRIKAEQTDKADKLNRQLSLQKDENKRLHLQLEQLIKERETLSKSLAKVNSKLANEKGKNKKLQEENLLFKREYIDYLEEKLAKKNKELHNYKSISKNQKKETIELKTNIEKYQKFDPEFLLEQLYALLSHDNVKSYKKAGMLNRKYLLTKKSYYRQKKADVKRVKELFGIYVEESGQSFVKDSNGARYEISSRFKGLLRDGDPVACELQDDDTVHIYWRYDAEEIMEEDKKLSSIEFKAKDNHSGASEKNINFNSTLTLKVGIVTSINGNKYVEKLSKHGMNAIWIDAFEKSPVHVKALMDGCDIVLLCVGSMPHFVLDLVTTDTKEKYHILTQHNEEIVINRVRLALLDK